MKTFNSQVSKKMMPKAMRRKVSEIKSSQKWKDILSGETGRVRYCFDRLPKENIRQSLLEEQRYLCAYCMRRLENNGRITSIKHWYPLSRSKEKALAYENMLEVCDGGRNWKEKGKSFLCCDAYKGEEAEMTLFPLNCVQMDMITYDRNEFIQIYPMDAGAMINVWRLGTLFSGICSGACYFDFVF